MFIGGLEAVLGMTWMTWMLERGSWWSFGVSVVEEKEEKEKDSEKVEVYKESEGMRGLGLMERRHSEWRMPCGVRRGAAAL